MVFGLGQFTKKPIEEEDEWCDRLVAISNILKTGASVDVKLRFLNRYLPGIEKSYHELFKKQFGPDTKNIDEEKEDLFNFNMSMWLLKMERKCREQARRIYAQRHPPVWKRLPKLPSIKRML